MGTHRAATDESSREFMVTTIGHPMDEILDSWCEDLELFLQLTDEALQLALLDFSKVGLFR